jgi:hypothetical protein
MTIEELLANPEALHRAHLAVEDVLIEYRDARISQPLRGNGAVIKEKDGTLSSTIRLGIDDVLRIGLTALVTP